ncbi:MAG: MBL fold metallo-hydrolase [Candidatus Syntropharchaeia archaeon]
MKIKPIAFDSLGVRSMATFVETSDAKILIDPGVALGPSRYGLPPHPVELKRKEFMWKEIKKYAKLADILIVTHYHYDHHNPEEPEIYDGKTVYIKHPKEKINRSQRERASYFLERISVKPEIADGKEYEYGSTFIRFSEPVYHGTNPRLGYVVEVSISHGKEKFVHSSDVEGPSIEDQARFVIEEDPDVLILDGPMTYMLGFRYSKKSLELSIENMIKIITETKIKVLVPDHHFTRDLNYAERITPVYKCALEKGVEVITAAEYAGLDVNILEARRKELYEDRITSP